jgi:hypothetical protein
MVKAVLKNDIINFKHYFYYIPHCMIKYIIFYTKPSIHYTINPKKSNILPLHIVNKFIHTFFLTNVLYGRCSITFFCIKTGRFYGNTIKPAYKNIATMFFYFILGRMEFNIAKNATPTSAKTAVHIWAIPNAPSINTMILTPNANTIF